MPSPVIHTPSRMIAGHWPTFVLPSDADIEYYEGRGGCPEAPLIEWAIDTFKLTIGTFVDIGAHIGTWSILFMMDGWDVVAFEPNPVIAPLTRAGLALSRRADTFGEYTLCQVALSDEPGVATLQAPYADGGGASIVVSAGHNPPINFQVTKSTLDNKALVPSLIKIDVEGAELDVLRGGKKTILRHQPKILFEMWADERGQRIEELLQYLNDDLNYAAIPLTWPEMWLAEPK